MQMVRLILIVVSLVTLPVYAQRNMSLSADFSSVLTGGMGIRYEYAVSDWLKMTVPVEVKSIQLSPLPNIVKSGIRDFWWSALPELTVLTGVGTQFHYHGWYLEPMLKLGYAHIKYEGLTGTKNLFLFQPTLLLGYSTTFEFGLLINVGIGFSGRLFMPTEDAKSFIAPDGVLAVGYAW